MSRIQQVVFRIQGAIAALIYALLPRSVHVKAFLYRLLWLLPERFRQTDPVREALKELGARHKTVRFVNVGANDGLAGDPLREFIITRGWTGILVEPVPFVFDRLVKAYRGQKNVWCDNAAISGETGTKEFWFIRKNDVLAPGYDQLASFDKNQVLKHETALPRLREFLECIHVPTLTVERLLEKHGFAGVDAILIDTEGYDAVIINQLDLGRLSPKLIVYENLNMSEQDNRQCEDRLRQAGYAITQAGPNTLAVKPL